MTAGGAPSTTNWGTWHGCTFHMFWATPGGAAAPWLASAAYSVASHWRRHWPCRPSARRSRERVAARHLRLPAALGIDDGSARISMSARAEDAMLLGCAAASAGHPPTALLSRSVLGSPSRYSLWGTRRGEWDAFPTALSPGKTSACCDVALAFESWGTLP